MTQHKLLHRYSWFIPYYFSIIHARSSIYYSSILRGETPKQPSFLKEVCSFVLRHLVVNTGPLFFAIVVNRFFYGNLVLVDILGLVLTFLLMFLIFFPLYEVGYIVNEWAVVKIEKEQYQTLRVAEIPSNISAISVAASVFRLALSFSLVYISPLQNKEAILYLSALVLTVFFIHNFIDVKYRVRSTYPMLQILKIIYVFVPIVTVDIEKMMVIVFAFSNALCITLWYSLKKAKKLSEFKGTSTTYFMSMAASFTILLFCYAILFKSCSEELLIFPAAIVLYYTILKGLAYVRHKIKA